MIPPLEDGMLPDGIHDCTLDEVERAFGIGGQRARLFERLRDYHRQVRSAGVAIALLIDGSYVTAKREPNDIDLVIVLPVDFDEGELLSDFEYSTINKLAIRRQHRFDAFPAADGSESYRELVEFFTKVRDDDPDQNQTRRRKGLLRVSL